jgi:small subunit ribosomal protein S1
MTEQTNQTQNETPETEVATSTSVRSLIQQDDQRYKGRKVKRLDLPEEHGGLSQDAQDLANLYEKMLMEYREGEIVKGKIIAIGTKEISIDIGFKSEGTVSADEFRDSGDYKIGDDVEVFLDRVEDSEGQLSLSKKKADFLKIWERIGEIHRTGEIVTGKIVRRVKGGMVVDMMTVDAFLPGSQIDVHPVRDFDALVGQDMEFRIVKLNDVRKNVVVSHKVIVEEGLADIRQKVLSEMEVGATMEGTVKNITDFGVFVDLGGVDGLLHITDLSWGRVGHPSEVVQLDQKIMVKILDYDKERQRISIGLKQLQPHPWEGVEEKYPVGKRVTGRVVSIARYGGFVELEKGLEGLIHISEMSWTHHIKHPSAMLSVGDEIEVVILNIDKEGRKISLGLKQVEPDPWENLEAKYAIGSKHGGHVRDLVPFGAFVELEDGIDGLVHISDLSWTRRVRHPGEILKKGEQVEVVILGFDRNERRIALGLKQAQDNPWDEFASLYGVGVQTTGKIVRVLEKGVVVELPRDVEGFVPNSQLKRLNRGSKQSVNIGEELNLEVIEFDKDSKKIILSALAPEGATEETEAEDETYKQYIVGSDVAEFSDESPNAHDESASSAESSPSEPEEKSEDSASPLKDE